MEKGGYVASYSQKEVKKASVESEIQTGDHDWKEEKDARTIVFSIFLLSPVSLWWLNSKPIKPEKRACCSVSGGAGHHVLSTAILGKEDVQGRAGGGRLLGEREAGFWACCQAGSARELTWAWGKPRGWPAGRPGAFPISLVTILSLV